MNPVLHINGCALFPSRYHIIPKVYTVLSTAYLETSVGAVHLLFYNSVSSDLFLNDSFVYFEVEMRRLRKCVMSFIDQAVYWNLQYFLATRNSPGGIFT